MIARLRIEKISASAEEQGLRSVIVRRPRRPTRATRSRLAQEKGDYAGHNVSTGACARWLGRSTHLAARLKWRPRASRDIKVPRRRHPREQGLVSEVSATRVRVLRRSRSTRCCCSARRRTDYLSAERWAGGGACRDAARRAGAATCAHVKIACAWEEKRLGSSRCFSDRKSEDCPAGDDVGRCSPREPA